MLLEMQNIMWIVLLIFSVSRVSQATVCKARGRFPNNIHPDCRGYTMCLTGVVGFTNYDLLCPEQSIYSHIENQCTNVTSYKCLPTYDCKQEGNFISLNSTDCRSYIACVKDLNDIITARLVTCNVDEIFNIIDNKCVNDTLYTCIPPTEPPTFFHVSVDGVPEFTGNFSFNKSSCINVTCLSIIMFIFYTLL